MSIEGIPPKMLACHIVEFVKSHEIREVPTSQSLGEHDLLLKTAVASLCHSDLEYQSGKFAAVKPLITASHEGTGVVVAKGLKVTQFNIGDRVLASHIANRCHDCEDCNGPEAYRHYCTYQAPHMSVGRDGAFAEYLVTMRVISNKIPTNVLRHSTRKHQALRSRQANREETVAIGRKAAYERKKNLTQLFQCRLF